MIPNWRALRVKKALAEGCTPKDLVDRFGGNAIALRLAADNAKEDRGQVPERCRKCGVLVYPPCVVCEGGPSSDT